MRYHIFYNMMAGHGDARAKAKKLSSIFEGDVEFHDVAATSYREFISSTPAEDVIVICGGDGTINRFANDTYDMEFPNDVLYFPAGSGNDFMHDVLDKAENGMIEINEYVKDLPTVTVNGETKKFINGIGFGIDGYCCEIGDEKKKVSDKPVNYTAIAISGLLFHFKAPNAKVTLDGVTKEYPRVWIAPTMNGRYYGGGMNVTPNQNRLNLERTVSLGVFYGKGRIKTLMVFPKIFKGEHVNHTEMFETLVGHEITVEFDRPCPLQIDGETVKNVTSYTVKSSVLAKI